MGQRRLLFCFCFRKIYCIGTLGAWYLGALWTDQFSETAEFPIYYYILIAFVSLLFIIGCVVIKTWRIANDNPVNSIKSE